MRRHVFFIRLTLVLLVLAFIWGNSLLPGDVSSQESEFVRRLLEPIAAPVQRLLAARGYEVSQSFLVRKAAHFSEYAALGVVMFLLFLKPEGGRRYIVPAGLCLAAAAVDEGIQIFADSRGPALRDVALDFAGSCTGILLTALIVGVMLFGRRRRKAP